MTDDEKHIYAEDANFANEQRHALIIGVNGSSKSTYLPALEYAEKDAYKMAEALEASACCFTIQKPILYGEKATTGDVKDAVVDLIRNSSDHDLLCFYFSGHAQIIDVGEGRQEVYLVTYDFSEKVVEFAPDRHLSMRWLWQMLYQKAKAERILLILDCCYAGNMSTEPDPYQIDFRELVNRYSKEENDDEKKGKSRTRLILSATGYNAVAYEKDGHGAMTGLILKALRGEVKGPNSLYDEDGYIHIHALHRYLQRMLPEQKVSLEGATKHELRLARHQLEDAKGDLARTDIEKAIEELKKIVANSSVKTFDKSLCEGASLKDLDIEAVTNFFQKARVQAQESDYYPGMDQIELLEQFGLLRQGHLTNGALLCFGKKPSQWIEGAFTHCIAWAGNNGDENLIMNDELFLNRSLIKQYELGIEFLRRNTLRRIIKDANSADELKIPEIVLREALANALIHREYASRTNPVQIDLFNDSIRISNPGVVPDGLSISQLDADALPPRRNPLIAHIFNLCGYVEEAGTGLARMQAAMRRAHLPPPKFTLINGRTFSVTLQLPQPQLTQIPTENWLLSVKKVVGTKRSYQTLSLMLLTTLIITLFISNFTQKSIITSNSSASLPINITSTKNGEPLGISDGRFAFDTARPDNFSKAKAAASLQQGDRSSAISLFQTSLAEDSSDAEALIYQEDQRVLASGKPYITLVVGTILTGNESDVGTGRDDLQGAYVAQKEYNDGSKLSGGTQVRLLIANAGSSPDNAPAVAQQIIQAAKQDPTIAGVMGWPTSAYARAAIPVLAAAHIPMVSQTASADDLSTISNFFFRVAPANDAQAAAAANYAKSQLHARRVALFVDPNNPYSKSLAEDFKNHFVSDTDTVVDTEQYTVHTQQQALPGLLQKSLSANPDLIYFSGYSDDLTVLLVNLPTSLPNLQILGGDALYQLNGYSTSARGGFSRLQFTAFAYPDEWDFLNMSSEKPLFFTEYPAAFNPTGQQPGGKYGYTRPDNDVTLSYDAMLALLQGSQNALNADTNRVTPTSLRDGLAHITSKSNLQGISGQIAFSSNDSNPVNKAIVVLYIDPVNHIKIKSVLGCLRVGVCG